MVLTGLEILKGIMFPFAGTALGAASVILIGQSFNVMLQRVLAGFAAGVMVAASVWSLLIPAMEQCVEMGHLAFVPAVVGFWFGILFLIVLDRIVFCMYRGSDQTEDRKPAWKKTMMMVLAVTLHNIPEGMAVGVACAGWLYGGRSITLTEMLTLSIGIGIQNIPEGAIISMPLRTEGMSRRRSLLNGILSGAVEPIAASITLLISSVIFTALPYLLSFAAGAMVFVVIKELIPEMSYGSNSDLGTLFFALGFTIMLALDVALG